MRITRKEKSAPAIVTPSGEHLYEMIGASRELGSASNQSLACSVIPPGKNSAAHYHKVSEETLYILQGSGRMQVDERTFTVETGDVIFLEPGEIHSLYNDSQTIELKQLAITAPPWSALDVYLSEESVSFNEHDEQH